MAEPVIITRDLTRCFGSFTAVDRLNFSIDPGEIVGCLGPNGCGKTTTIRMLLGLLEPSRGSATVLGFDAFRQSEQVRARSGYMSQKFALYDDMTVSENLVFYAGVYGIRDRSRLEQTLSLVGLSSHRSALARSLSAGWRQRLALAIALVHKPALLFLDEPTSGVDPTARRAFWDLIYQLAGEGVTVLVTTHYMDEAEYCSRVGIMRDGKLLALDTPAALKASVVPGEVWEVHIHPLETALASLQSAPGILRVGLAGDHLRVIAASGQGESAIRQAIPPSAASSMRTERGEPTLEDVFLSLARN